MLKVPYKCPCCNQNTENLTIEVSEMTQDDFIKRKLDIGYINFTVFGYTVGDIENMLKKLDLPKK